MGNYDHLPRRFAASRFVLIDGSPQQGEIIEIADAGETIKARSTPVTKKARKEEALLPLSKYWLPKYSCAELAVS